MCTSDEVCIKIEQNSDNTSRVNGFFWQKACHSHNFGLSKLDSVDFSTTKMKWELILQSINSKFCQFVVWTFWNMEILLTNEIELSIYPISREIICWSFSYIADRTNSKQTNHILRTSNVNNTRTLLQCVKWPSVHT